MLRKLINTKSISNIKECYQKSSKIDKMIILSLFNVWIYSLTHFDHKLLKRNIPPYL